MMPLLISLAHQRLLDAVLAGGERIWQVIHSCCGQFRTLRTLQIASISESGSFRARGLWSEVHHHLFIG